MSDQEVLRKSIVDKIKKANPLMEMYISDSLSSGWVGYNPEMYTTSAVLEGSGKYHGWRDEDKAFYHIPSFGFKFTLTRMVSSPCTYGDRASNIVAMKSSGVHTIVDDNRLGDVTVNLSLPDKLSFSTRFVRKIGLLRIKLKLTSFLKTR
ncbi:MAG: hypothetical protein HY225_01620 [Candidatus Vogelbacteria bacterium]|nr:hypothetical protein [Candidatus Vogelbacteria bacterium]